MNKRASFYRKVAYVVGIAVLLFPLAYLSRPATVTEPQGGLLSAKRFENGLSQANLGEIDPASETMRLATLGLRGVAVNLLWNKADEYKKKEDWTNLTATLEQLARLQPNIITFWKYQSWNLSYNVSVLFDDYRDRYYYVRKGIEFLNQGVEKNKDNRQIPQLLWDMGWFVGHKIGRADEYVQYRELFRNDDEFHGDDPPPGSDERDNWLVSKMEYLDGIAAINERGKSIGKKSEKIYYSSPAKSQMNYAEAIEEEGQFEKAQAAWKVSADDWRDFGDQVIEHSTGRRLQLGREDELTAAVKKLEQELYSLIPGLRDKMIEEQREKLSDLQQAALDTPDEERTQEQWSLAQQAGRLLEVSDLALVDRIAKEEPELRKQASLMAQNLADRRTTLIFTQRYKDDANYDYWALRAEFEQTDAAVEARRKMFQGKRAFADRQASSESKELYEQGFRKWREVLDTFPELMNPRGVTGGDLLDFVRDYRRVLRSMGEPIPDDFPLWDVIERFDVEGDFEEELLDHQRQTNRSDSQPSAEEASAEEDSATSESTSEEGSEKPPREETPEQTAAGEEPRDDTTANEPESANSAEGGENSGEPEVESN